MALLGIAGPPWFTTLVIIQGLLQPDYSPFAIPDDAPLHEWAGFLQRVLCAVWFSCLIALAIRLRRVG